MRFPAVGWVRWSHLTKRSIYIKLSWQADQRDIEGTFCMISKPWSLGLGRLEFDSQLCHLLWSLTDHETNLCLKCWRSIAFQKMSPHHLGGKFIIVWRWVCFPLLSLRTEELLLLLLSHFSRVRLCATPKTAAHQAPPSLGFSRQEHWSGLPFPSPMHESEVAQSCLTLSDPMDCSLPGSFVHGIFQAKVLIFYFSFPFFPFSVYRLLI